MFKRELDKKIMAYIDKLFSGVGPNQPLFDLKEELATNIKEKIVDYKSRGMDEQQAFKEAIISMGDLSGLVEDMRKLGQDAARQTVYSTMSARISTAGLVAGAMLILFGMFTAAMLYFMDDSGVNVAGVGIFIVVGGVLVTYSALTRETSRKYGMNKIRAGLYALAIGLLLFSLFVATVTHFSVGEPYVTIASLMFFFIAGAGLFLFLLLTGTNRRKPVKHN